MPARWCIDCGTLYNRDTAPGQRCPTCQTTHDAKRGTSSQRGLGWAFSRRKAADTGYQAATHCHWCGGPFTTDDPKTADHTKPRSRGGSDGPIVAAHRSCNSSRGGKLAHE